MPSLILFERRTLLGGDDVHLACIITILMRVFQFFILLLPIFIFLFREVNFHGFFAYFFNPIHNSFECQQSYRVPLLTLIYCLATTIYFGFSVLVEIKLIKAGSVGTPIQSHLRNKNVAYWIEMKMIPLNIFLFTVFVVGVAALSRSKMFYLCLKNHQQHNSGSGMSINVAEFGENDEYKDFYQNNTQLGLEYIRNCNLESSKKCSSSRMSLIFFWILATTQALEVLHALFSIIRLFRKPKGMHVHATLEEFIRSGGDHSNYTENYHYHEQDHIGLYDALWEERCKFWCICSGKATCFLFGGREVGSGDYGDISKVLTDYFEHGGTLDIVPSDIVAGFIVLQKIQKQRRQMSQKCIMRSMSTFMERESSYGNIKTELDLDLKNLKEISKGRISSSSSSVSLPSSYSDVFYDVPDDESMARPSLAFTTNGTMQLGLNPPSILIRDRRSDREIIGEGARFVRHALAIYTWILYVYMKPISGFCGLCCPNFPCSQHGKQCSLFQCNKSKSLEDDRLNEKDTTSTNITGDNCCHMHKKALLRQAGLTHADLIYAQFENGLKETPYCIILDHKWKSVVLAIRGTLSLEDCVMDVLVSTKPLDELGNKFGFDGQDEFVHSGIYETTQWIFDDLNKHRILEHLLLGKSAPYPNYTLRIVGHSLGAGCATLISLMLRQTYPSLRCLAYSPPGGFSTKGIAILCKEFVTSYVLNTDLVPRLSIHNMQKLRNEILSLIGRIRVPKVQVYQSVFSSDVDSSLETLLHPNDSYSSNTDYANQLEKFKQIQKERKQHRGAVDVEMFPPGKIIHLVKTYNNKSSCGIYFCSKKSYTNIESQYTPCWADNEDFNEIVISPSMYTDHFPSNICLELENMAKYFGLDVSLGSCTKDIEDDIWYEANALDLESD